MNTKRKIAIDMILNIGGTAIPTLLLQLVILPLLAAKIESDQYGLAITIIAFITLISSATGSMLNNIRLIYDAYYKEKGYDGDYNIILVVLGVLNALLITLFSIIYDSNYTFYSLILTIIITLSWYLLEYLIVAFRLKINYKAILYTHLLKTIGYFVGYALFCVTRCWQMIYVVGNLFGLTYIVIKSDLLLEPYRITPAFKITINQGTKLLIANFFSYILTYADKFLVFPVLGGTMVAIYSTSCTLGKVISLAISPVNSVSLTYLAKMKKRRNDYFKYAFMIGTGFCLCGYFICIIISKPILSLIYPQFVDEAVKYIWITTGTAVINAMISIINPFILRFFDMKWQMVLTGITATLYIILCVLLASFYGLIGFCYGTMITAIIKAILTIIIYNRCRERV